MVFRRCIAALGLALFVALGAGHVFWPHFTINNGSMSPTIAVGEEVILVKSDAYKAGDIVTVKSGLSFMTHRLKGYGPNGELITRGDANQADDPVRVASDGTPDPLTAKDIQGKVLVAVPFYEVILVFWMLVMIGLFIWGTFSSPPGRHSARGRQAAAVS